jgi:spermidine/putrescine transport system permease protein
VGLRVRRVAGAGVTTLTLGAAYAFIFLPVIVLVLFSFHAGRVPVPPFHGPTLLWYEKLLSDDALVSAMERSLIVGVSSAACATLLGFSAAYGLARHVIPMRRGLQLLLLLPLSVSTIVVGIGLLIGSSALELGHSLLLVGAGHVAINLPIAFTICLSALGGHHVTYERAARDLGASGFQVLTRITMPLVWPALFASFCLCFTFSWDEFIIAFFLSGFDVTLPVAIWGMLRTGLNPEINAAGTLVFLFSLLLFLVFEMLVFGRGFGRRRNHRP